jgi:zinc transporter 1/2/3
LWIGISPAGCISHVTDWVCVAAGLLQVFLSHRPLSFATSLLLACALCIHSILEGLALGAQQSMQVWYRVLMCVMHLQAMQQQPAFMIHPAALGWAVNNNRRLAVAAVAMMG